jgi:hypothetical protein
VTEIAGVVIQITCNEYFATPGYGVMPETNPVLPNKYSYVVMLLSGMRDVPGLYLG